MPLSPFEQMQRAVDIVGGSPHPTNKIAATLFGFDLQGHEFSISCTNFWPDKIRQRIGTEIRIGNASGTIHAETACILQAPRSEGASICITDPFCPNCAKNIAEAGIKNVYIDHKGFQKDFVSRRGKAFANMSMQVCAKAGISVYELWRKEERLVPIYEPPEGYIPPEEFPVSIAPCALGKEAAFKALIKDSKEIYKTKETQKECKFACALAMNQDKEIFALAVCDHPAIGYSLEEDLDEIENPQGKYSFILEPVNRLLMAAPRNGLRIIDGFLFCSQVPTSREQVNMVGVNLTHIHISDKGRARDDYGLAAMETLTQNKIISYD